MRQYFAIAAFGLLTACARLDHVQIGEIDQSQGTLIPFNAVSYTHLTLPTTPYV